MLGFYRSSIYVNERFRELTWTLHLRWRVGRRFQAQQPRRRAPRLTRPRRQRLGFVRCAAPHFPQLAEGPRQRGRPRRLARPSVCRRIRAAGLGFRV